MFAHNVFPHEYKKRFEPTRFLESFHKDKLLNIKTKDSFDHNLNEYGSFTLHTSSLVFYLESFSRTKTRQMIAGEYQLPLNTIDLAGPVEEWKDLAPVDDGSNQYLGDLCLSLRYVPSSGKLTGMDKTSNSFGRYFCIFLYQPTKTGQAIEVGGPQSQKFQFCTGPTELIQFEI